MNGRRPGTFQRGQAKSNRGSFAHHHRTHPKEQYRSLRPGKAKDETPAKLLTAFLRKADEGTLGRVLGETVILLSMRSAGDSDRVLRDAASLYKVNVNGIAVKAKQEFAAKQKTKPAQKTVRRSRQPNAFAAPLSSAPSILKLLPSVLTQPTPAVAELAAQLDVQRRDDPMTVLRELNVRLHDYFDYVPRSTTVNTPVDEAIEQRKGVCQDFTHTMIALVRHIGIPCRYVSGYLHHTGQDGLRSLPLASHAWMDAFLPHLGWVGFDPTNNVIAHTAHIRTALGRDYSDVPPTRGIYRGVVTEELHVAVQVTEHPEAPPLDPKWPIPEDWSIHVERAMEPPPPASPVLQLQQLEQQQQ